MATTPNDQRYNRDEDLKVPAKAGQPPRPASEPAGAEGASKASRTATDPVTGAPKPSGPRRAG
jgi:hypothetical protein